MLELVELGPGEQVEHPLDRAGGLGHVALVDTASPYLDDLVTWTTARLADAPAALAC